jgi:hypothetical protein
MTRVKISRMVIDFKLYPRVHLNDYHVEEIVEALKAGTQFPPITIDKATRRVTDGFHRIEANRKLYGETAVIEANLKEYKDEAEMFEDSVRLNSSHGQGLSKMDKAHCLAKAEEFDIEPTEIATLLNLTTEKANELISNRMALSGDKKVVLKGSTAWMAGKNITSEQVRYNTKAGGMNQTFYINQVIAMLENDAVDWENDLVTNGLNKLSKLLEAHLTAKV